MAERDLDRYLEGLGIDVDGDEAAPPERGGHDHDADELVHEQGADHDDGIDADDLLGEDALDGAGSGGGSAVHTDGAGARVGAARDRWADDDEIDFERALAGAGLGGVVPDDLAPDQRAETFLVQLLLYLDPTYAVDVSVEHDGTVHIDVHGGDAGRLIGKGGRTLAALEFLTNAVVNKVEGEPPVRVNVDIGGYKRRRDERLRQVAQRAAARVRKTGMPVELEPMSAAERRVVHVELADDPAVTSESAGEGRDRRVVIHPAADHG
jgi:spoIIIJ-associated protein